MPEEKENNLKLEELEQEEEELSPEEAKNIKGGLKAAPTGASTDPTKDPAGQV